MNKFKPHLLVLPEDDANRQMANGFLLDPNLNTRVIQILPPSGGWLKVLDDFERNHITVMQTYKHRMMLLLIDFDQDEGRLDDIKNRIPAELKDRVFALGAQSEPENLKKQVTSFNTLEDIGKTLARDCVDESFTLWEHDLLKHNKSELARITSLVRPFLFY